MTERLHFHLYKDPVFKPGHILRTWGLELHHISLGARIQPITGVGVEEQKSVLDMGCGTRREEAWPPSFTEQGDVWCQRKLEWK